MAARRSHAALQALQGVNARACAGCHRLFRRTTQHAGTLQARVSGSGPAASARSTARPIHPRRRCYRARGVGLKILVCTLRQVLPIAGHTRKARVQIPTGLCERLDGDIYR